MAVKLKNLNEQVMVITGATSGIGLTPDRIVRTTYEVLIGESPAMLAVYEQIDFVR